MPQVHLVLSHYLTKHGLKVTALVDAVHPYLTPNTVYRLLREEEAVTRIDFPTLAALMVGLRQMTGRPVELADILEFDIDAPTLHSTRRKGGGGKV